MKVLILAGGFGTRLSEETDIRPKPMVEIGGKPILWHIMKIYSTYGFNDFVILDLSKYWHFKNPKDAYKITGNIPFHEAGLLKLNCDKALFYLKWQANLEYKDTIKFTSDWYYSFYKTHEDMYKKTIEQINDYVSIAKTRMLQWTE